MALFFTFLHMSLMPWSMKAAGFSSSFWIESGLSLLLHVALVGMQEESPASPASYRCAVAGGSSVIMAFSGGRGLFSLLLHRNTDSGGVSRGNCGIRGHRNKLVHDHIEARWSALPFEGWFCAAMHCHLEITGSPGLCKPSKPS